jgi:hypothetical protein
MKKSATPLSQNGNANENNTEIPSHPGQSGDAQENKQGRLARKLGM